MKHVITILLFIAMCSQGLQAQNNAIDKYFSKYADDDAFTSVYISEYMFSLFANADLEDEDAEDVVEILSDLTSLQVLTTDKHGLKLYDEALGLINKTEYKVLMKVKDEGSKVQFLLKKDGKQVKELLLLVGSDDEFVLLSIVGNIALNKISKLAKHMDIQGLEHLEKVEEK